MVRRKWQSLLSAAFLGLLLAGCSGPEACSFSATARAWVDTNQNGQLEEGESALPGVRFSINGDLDLVREGVSDERGESTVGSYDMSCSGLSVCAEPPAGYQTTTPGCREIRWPVLHLGTSPLPGELLFGVAPVSQAGKEEIALAKHSTSGVFR